MGVHTYRERTPFTAKRESASNFFWKILSNSFHDVAKKPRATIDVACVNLKKLGAGLEFLTGGLCIANSTGSDHGDFGSCENAAHQRR